MEPFLKDSLSQNLFTLRVFACNLRGSQIYIYIYIYIFKFYYRCLTKCLNHGLTSNKPTLYLLDCDEIYFLYKICIHTYIIGHCKPSVRITAEILILFSLCALLLYVSGGSNSLTSAEQTDFCETFSWQDYLLSEFLPAEIYFSYFVLMPDQIYERVPYV